MIHLEKRYFTFNKILLLTIGLWPYGQSKLTRLQFIFLSIILVTATIFQLTTFITAKFYSPILIGQILSTVVSYISFMITYSSFCININNVKNLLMQLEHIYNELKDKNEIAIIEKYGYNAKRYTALLTTFAIFGIILITIVLFSTGIANVILTNKSQIYSTLIMTEYFVDQERYYFLILLHMYAAFLIGAMAMLATGTMLLTFLQLTCGIFTVSCYRIEHALNFNMLKNTFKKDNLISKGIVCAVDFHRKAMKLAKDMMSRFQTSLFLLIIFGVASLSLNLLRISQIESFEKDATAVPLPLIFILTSILYMFLANSIGQDIIDHSHQIFFTTYNVPWYLASLHVQKIILFLLQRTAKDFSLTVGGLFVASFECFATLLKAAVSYFTVIYSMR